MTAAVIRPALLFLLFLLLILAACAPRPAPPPHLTLTPTRFSALAGWRQDHIAAAVPAFVKSCAVLRALAPGARLGIAGTAGDWRAPCAAAAGLAAATDDQARAFFEGSFVPYLAADNDKTEGLFTGYFEPELAGARMRGAGFATPLLRRPPDLVSADLGPFRPSWRGERTAGRVVDGQLRPYPTRAEIERGALARDHLALLWVASPIDAFFLQIQGSGRVRLPDGSLVAVGYAGDNGRPYVAIGRLLIERGALTRDQVSLATIRAWLKAHPDEAGALMDANPSYVFFREITGPAPLGSEGVALTPGRSLAVDRAFVPLGVPVWLDIAQGDRRWRRLMVAQDTGGAIRGPVRGDVFWGTGPTAEAQAGGMRAHGEYVILLPRTVAAAR